MTYLRTDAGNTSEPLQESRVHAFFPFDRRAFQLKFLHPRHVRSHFPHLLLHHQRLHSRSVGRARATHTQWHVTKDRQNDVRLDRTQYIHAGNPRRQTPSATAVHSSGTKFAISDSRPSKCFRTSKRLANPRRIVFRCNVWCMERNVLNPLST